MIFLIFIVSAGLLALSTGCSSTQKQASNQIGRSGISNGRNIIKSIEFVGNDSIKDKTLKKKLDFKVGDYLDSILASSGRIILSDYYRKKGFADVQVTLDSTELSAGRVVYDIVEGPRLRIRSVKFKGNKIIQTGKLKNVIKIKTRSWLFWPVYYTDEKVAADVQNLRTFYFNRGFLNHDIKSEGRERITFVIDEGPQYRVGQIIVEGNTYFDSKKLLEGLELKTGQIYYPQKAQAQALRILKLYHENGFINVQLEQRYNFAPAGTNVVDVKFNITEGNQFRIGRIDITGNEQTQDKVIRRVLDEYDFTPGQLYNANLAPVQGNGDLEINVKGRTMAEEVIIKPVIPAQDTENKRDVSVNIKEGLTGMWNPGIAIGSDSGVVGQLIWRQLNFDITDWPESFGEFITMQSFKGAGQNLSIELYPGTQVSYYSIAFTEPYFQDKPMSLSVGGSSWERWYRSHDEKRTKGYVGFGKRYKNRWRSSLGFRVEDVEITDLDYDAPQEIIDVRGHNLLVGARFGIGRDTTDYIYLPSNGYKYEVSYEQVTGDDDFGILEGSSIWYRTLYKDFRDRKTILASKILAGTTLSNAPPFENYYAGGIGKYGIRGFEYRGVSTRGLQTNVPDPRRKDPIGSDWIVLANTELTVPLVGENISALFFVDSGAIDTGPYRISTGVGIQIMVPQIFGPAPMRFTFGFPLQKDDEDERQSFSFFMGGGFFQ
jgi:outer membrane protein insertion porin family